MCGWVVWWRPLGLPEKRRLETIRDIMAVRGPDGSGLWQEGAIALAHRRLAILDLSQAAHQPMERQRLITVFNGEIYNYRALRRELEQMGLRFQSTSDTEILPLGLRTWGFRGLLEKLDGMFAFAIWDADMQTLYLARDRIGKKPLYYSFLGSSFTAASDLRCVLASLDATPPVATGLLPLYLYHGFIPAPWSIFEGISKLMPATGAIVRLNQQRLQKDEICYWRLSYEPKVRIHQTEAIDEVDRLLRAAVGKRLVADVPLGAFLSGGVDSGLVVSYAAEARPGLDTFCIGFDCATHDERAHARTVATRYATKHHETTVALNALADLESAVQAHGEPFADSSAIPTRAVARAARQHVTVALTGDGGDELFAGYPSARAAWIAGHYQNLVPDAWRRRADRLATRLATEGHLPNSAKRLWTLLRYGAAPRGEVYLDPDLWRDDLGPALLAQAVKEQSLLSPRGWHRLLQERYDAAVPLDIMLGLDVQARLPNDYLTKVDVATMSAALEARSPLLDVQLLEFVARLPRHILMPGGQSKGLLKKLAARRLPYSVVYRPKHGFAMPLAQWMRGPYLPFLRERLLSKRCLDRGWFGREAIERTIAEHAAGKVDHAARLWALLVWETWCRQFLDNVNTQSAWPEAA